jgi:CTP-dependent riboflavin kinase
MAFKLSNEEFLFQIGRYIADHGHSPTYQELGRITELGSASVWRKLSELDDEGFIERVPNKHRSIMLTEKAKELFLRRYADLQEVLVSV